MHSNRQPDLLDQLLFRHRAGLLAQHHPRRPRGRSRVPAPVPGGWGQETGFFGALIAAQRSGVKPPTEPQIWCQFASCGQELRQFGMVRTSTCGPRITVRTGDPGLEGGRMSLVYRAIWQDTELHEVCNVAGDAFGKFVSEKWGVKVPDAGTVTALCSTRDSECQVEVNVATARSGGEGKALRAELLENYVDGATWRVLVQAWSAAAEQSQLQGDSAGNWIWVDVEVVGDEDVSQSWSAAPRLVNALLRNGVKPTVDGDLLIPKRTHLQGHAAGEELAELISRPERSLPVIVINDAPTARARAAQHNLNFPDVVSAVGKATGGIAVVYTVDAEAADGIIAALGKKHGLWDGAMRVYRSDVDPAADGNDWRHRYFTADRYAISLPAARRSVGKLLGPISAVRRPPPSYAIAKRLLEKTRTSGDADALLALADAEVSEKDHTIGELRDQLRLQDESLEGFAFDLELAALEHSEVLRELENLRRHVASLQTQLSSSDAFYELPEQEDFSLSVDSVSAAVEMARRHLGDRLVIPSGAPRELDELDAAVTSAPWGKTTWQGFVALHAYACDRADGWNGGGFWEWCQSSRNPKAWRATDKKLAMVESKALRDSSKLWRTREFPISTEVTPTGRMHMEAHLKIATGGGNLAPRVYFYLDEERSRIHVGFVGPHKLVPNSKA